MQPFPEMVLRELDVWERRGRHGGDGRGEEREEGNPDEDVISWAQLTQSWTLNESEIKAVKLLSNDKGENVCTLL